MSNWVQKDAAELLGISPRVMNYKIKTLRIDLPRSRRPVGRRRLSFYWSWGPCPHEAARLRPSTSSVGVPMRVEGRGPNPRSAIRARRPARASLPLRRGGAIAGTPPATARR